MSSNLSYLSLFSGAAGGDLAMQHLLGFRCLGYVEYEPYCQKVLKQRITDGLLDSAPIWGDIRGFIQDGVAEAYTGMVDLCVGGFPCQPFSVAGKRAGADDPRNMWPATLEVIRIVRPRWAFLENVPGLLTSGYFATIVEGLASLGLYARWGVFSACAFGAPHPRERMFALANSKGQRQGQLRRFQCAGEGKANRNLCWATTEPPVERVAHGVAHRVERLRATGNGQVPICAAVAWKILSGLA